MFAFRTRSVAAAAVLALAGGALAFSTPADAAAPTSYANGRFLSGQAGGTSFDTVAALNGETATYPGSPGPNENDLSGSLLGQSFAGPAKNVSVPFPGGVTFGAVGQYAKAAADGSAHASSGLIGSNGAINVGGSGNDPAATIDLSKLPNASSLTDVLGNLKLSVGAVSAQAKQAAFGKKLADPSAGCGSRYLRVSDPDQAGSYRFASLTLGATSPLLKQVGTQLSTNFATLLSQLNAAAQAIPGGLIEVSGVPTADDIADDLSISLLNGGVTADLADGTFTIDLTKMVDLNSLCPNTSLLPYIAGSLARLPAAIASLLDGLNAKFADALGGVTVTLAGTPLTATELSDLFKPFIDMLATNLTAVTDAVTTGLDPAIDAVSDQLLDVVVNAQNESNGTFTQTAVQVNLIPGGGSLPSIPGAPTLPTIPMAAAKQAGKTGTANASAQTKRDRAGKPSSSKPSSKSSTSAPVPGVTLPAVNFADGRLDLGPIALSTAASEPALQLNLASASVSNSTPAASTPTTSTTPPAPAVASGTAIPNAVSAGEAGSHGMSPLVLLLLGVIVTAGAGLGLRRRARGTH